MTSILDQHESLLRQPYHEGCGGTILGGDDGYRYCDTCGAFQRDPYERMPSGTDAERNWEARDAGEDASPSAIAVLHDGQTIYAVREDDIRALGGGDLSDALAALNAMTGEEYGEWCDSQELPADAPDVQTPEMGEYCQKLIDDGALYVYLDADRYVADRRGLSVCR